MFGTDTGASDIRMHAGLRALAAPGAGRGALHDMYTATMVRQLDLAIEVAPAFTAALPSGGELTRELTIAARLINADIGLRVIDISRGGFDTHDSQNSALPGLLHDLNAAARFSDRMALMAGGRLLCAGTVANVLTEPVLREAYGVEVCVMTAPDGRPVVIPLRPHPRAVSIGRSSSPR